MRTDQKDFLRVNERIHFSPIRLIGSDGAQIGVLPTKQALAMAREQSLDLIEIAPDARPPVCRIMDYGKYKFEQKKKEKEVRAKQKVVSFKEIRCRPSIGAADLDTKLRAIQKFLEDGHKVRVRIEFKKRENAHQDLGLYLANDILKRVAEYGKPHAPPRLEGRDIFCILEPIKG